MTWWKVKSPDLEFLVLVVDGRVAANTLTPGSLVRGDSIGALWSEARKKFEQYGFECTMETL